MRGMFVRVLVSAVLFLSAKLIEEIIQEVDRIDERVETKTSTKIIQVLPRAREIFARK